MPRYYFDLNDGEHATTDDDGQDLPNAEQARKEAIKVLPALATDLLPNGDLHEFMSLVRDQTGKPIFRATLTLFAEWLDDRSADKG